MTDEEAAHVEALVVVNTALLHSDAEDMAHALGYTILCRDLWNGHVEAHGVYGQDEYELARRHADEFRVKVNHGRDTHEKGTGGWDVVVVPILARWNGTT